MTTPVLWLMVAACLLVAMRAEAKDLGLDPARIAEVAGWLPAGPAGVGPTIADRAAWDPLRETVPGQGFLARAEALLTQPLPEQPEALYLEFSRTGNRTRWQDVAFRRRGRLDDLVVAECLDHRGRFVPAIEQLVAALCAEPTWLYPAHDGKLTNFRGEVVDIDLGSASLGWNLATADHLLGDRLGDGTRALIRDHLDRRIVTPYRAMVDNQRAQNWWMFTTSNWNSVCLAGVTGVALAQVADAAERARFVVAAEKLSENYLNGFAADGYCTEGTGYWNYGFGYYLLLCETVHQATGGQVDLLGRPGSRRPAEYGARIPIVEGLGPAFADCPVNARPDPGIMAFVNRRLALAQGPNELPAPLSARGSLYQQMLYSFPNSASLSSDPPPSRGAGLRSWFDAVGILVARPAPGSGCRLAVALKGGHNAEHHNHNDVGSYVVVVGERPVLLDPGAETYTARTFSSRRYESKLLNSYGHPVPKVAGQLQRTGADARGEVLASEFTDLRDTLTLSLKSAYAVPELEKLERTWVYDRTGAGCLTVTDSFRFSSPRAFGTALITAGTVEQIGQSLRVIDTDEMAEVTISAAGGELVITEDEIHEESKIRPLRVGLDFAQPLTEGSVTAVIRPLVPPAGAGLVMNGDFELKQFGWQIGDQGLSSISEERAASGRYSLKIVDQATNTGSNVTSAKIPITAAGEYRLEGRVYTVSGSGVGMYVYYLDEQGQMLNERDQRGYIAALGSAQGPVGKWMEFGYRFTPPAGTVALRIWIHSANAGLVEAYLDDLAIYPPA